MPRVFICYRRDDAPASAGRLYDRLTERFGRDHVFEPVVPAPPEADESSGEPDDVGCSHDHPGLGIALTFTALRYPSGTRVTEVTCYDTTTGDDVAGGARTGLPPSANQSLAAW